MAADASPSGARIWVLQASRAEDGAVVQKLDKLVFRLGPLHPTPQPRICFPLLSETLPNLCPFSLPSINCSVAHRERKKQEAREKTRVRMARYRLKLKSAPAEEQEASKVRAREARARYREKNRTDMLASARCKRIEEFGNKYGLLAFEAKLRRSFEKKCLKFERRRRKGRPHVKKHALPVAQSDADDDEDDDEDDKRRRAHIHELRKARRRRQAAVASDSDDDDKEENTSDPQAPISPGWNY
ncbi:hypothetical protein C8F04DRAFT_1190896 [Mycena alexandri]|uniref:Uncharacterized protein n=1 Tax=Mycena alexandri TaxID=1745969 RepID=A0AAD6WV94_9AGAR|nr:hypothetical protein C8F04DRAFT_1190896 [Mycena alexandri]